MNKKEYLNINTDIEYVGMSTCISVSPRPVSALHKNWYGTFISTRNQEKTVPSMAIFFLMILL